MNSIADLPDGIIASGDVYKNDWRGQIGEKAFESAENERKFNELLDEAQLAKYKIEIMFNHGHNAHGPTRGMICFWESGRFLNGDGDSKVYLCESIDNDDKSGCGKFIMQQGLSGPWAICPHCQKKWASEQLTGEIYYYMSLQKWAQVVCKWFRRMDSRADIYMKYGPQSIRAAQFEEERRKLEGDLLYKAQEKFTVAIYPLKNILKDTANGADLEGRLRSFLSA